MEEAHSLIMDCTPSDPCRKRITIMALVQSYRGSDPVSSALPASRFTGLVASLVESWQKARAARQIESLPDGLLKDIGWPAAENRP